MLALAASVLFNSRVGTSTNAAVNERFHTLITSTFDNDNFAGHIKVSPRTRQKIIELQTTGTLSVSVTCTLKDEPDAITVLRPGDSSHTMYEDIYFVHGVRLVVQTCFVNTSGRSMLGFATSRCLSVDNVTPERLDALAELLSGAVLHENPMVQL